ncbi:translocation/assembly module TamB [Marinilabiliaceae bacterium JC017]|nr:translocation/assembly module TamB [Marinilabiliaceae bacterium JC017]
MLKRILKYIALTLVALLLLLVLTALVTQTAVFRTFLKNQLITQANKTLNAQLHIESLRGNLIKEIHLSGIAFTMDDSTLAHIESLSIYHSPKSLLKKIIRVDSLILSTPKILLYQEADSTWNISHMVKKTSDTTTTQPGSFNFTIDLANLKLKKGRLDIHSQLAQIPASIHDINLIGQFNYQPDDLLITLHHFGFQTQEPTFALKHLAVSLRQQNNNLQVSDLEIELPASQINANANFENIKNFTGEIQAQPISHEDIRVFIPDFTLNTSPILQLSATNKKDVLNLSLSLKSYNERLSINGKIPGLSLLKPSKKLSDAFSFVIKTQKFTPSKWLAIEAIPLSLSGNIQVSGKSINPAISPLKLKADLSGSNYFHFSPHHLLINGSYTGQTVQANVEIDDNLGNAHIMAHVDNLHTHPEYSSEIAISNFRLDSLISGMKQTNLNLQARFNGSGFDLPTIVAEGTIKIREAEIEQIPVDSLLLSVNLKEQQITIPQLAIFTSGMSLAGNGNYHLKENHLDFMADSKIDHLDGFSAYLPEGITIGKGLLSLSANGKTDSLLWTTNLQVTEAALDSIMADTVFITARGAAAPNHFAFTSDLSAKDLFVSGITIDSLRLASDFSDYTLSSSLHALLTDSMETKVTSRLELGDTLTIHLPNMEFITPMTHYYNVNEDQRIEIHGKTFHCHQLNIRNKKNPQFNLEAHGTLSLDSTENFSLNLAGYDLNHLNATLKPEQPVSGYLDTHWQVTGEASAPIIDGSLTLNNISYVPYFITLADNRISVKNNQASLYTMITSAHNDTILANAEGPFNLNLQNDSLKFSLPQEVKANIQTTNFDLGNVIQKFTNKDIANGQLTFNIDIDGEIKNPRINGFLNIDDGQLQLHQYGIEIDDAIARIRARSKEIFIDSLFIKRQDGFLKAHGSLQFDSTLLSGNIISTELTTVANQFYLTKHRDYEIQIDANTFIKSANQQPEFGGWIKVLRSSFYLPAFTSTPASGQPKDVPMLVDAINQSKHVTPDSVMVTEADKTPKKPVSDRMERLTGRIRIEFPRNTWLKSEDMRLEIGGDLEIEKSGPFFELFGTVNINRGYYVVYGKRLNILEGELTFQGGEKIDPMLNFTAQHTFRDEEKKKRELEMIVTGLLSAPEIAFTLDNQEITTSDAFAYLLFGQSMDNLSFNNQNGVAGAMSSNMVANLVSSQLSKTLGNRLNLDLIEVNATDNWQSAAFVVGKYVTNNLFVIYQRGFGETQDDEITPETITLEYEINKNLFLRLQSGDAKTSGFDVILKFESKSEEKNNTP